MSPKNRLEFELIHVLQKAFDGIDGRYKSYYLLCGAQFQNDTASINITVLNVNEWEPRFKYPQYEFRVEADSDAGGGGLLPVGRLEVFDGDAGDNVTLTLRGSDAR